MSEELPLVRLVTGIPGASKTTVARALAERLPRATHVEGEALWRRIVSGRETPDPDLHGEAERQYELVVEQQCLLARSYLRAGIVPGAGLRRGHGGPPGGYQEGLAGYELRLVVLAPDLRTTRDRDARRGGKTGSRFEFLDAVLRRELSGAGRWIDSSALSVEETVTAILEAGWGEAAPLPNGGAAG